QSGNHRVQSPGQGGSQDLRRAGVISHFSEPRPSGSGLRLSEPRPSGSGLRLSEPRPSGSGLPFSQQRGHAMKRLLATMLVVVRGSGLGRPMRGDEKDPTAILDKAIKALGGAEKLSKAEAMTWKGKGTLTFNDNERTINFHATLQGLDHYRGEIE